MKKTASVLTLVALCGATCFSPATVPTAQAQDLGGALDLPMLGRDLALSAAIRAQAKRDAERMSGWATKSNKKRVAPKGTTRFQTNFAVRKRNLAQFISNVRRFDPRGAAALQQIFAKSDPIAAIAPGLKRYNLRTDDVADAATVYLVSSWYGARGSNEDPPSSYVNGVRQQMRGVLLAVPQFAAASNATKQQMAEALLVQTMVTDALVTSAKGNPAQMAKVKTAVSQGVRNSFQLNLNRMKLSSRGLHL